MFYLHARRTLANLSFDYKHHSMKMEIYAELKFA